MKIFISHSSKDTELAEALINLLKWSLPLRSEDIRCTSVDGYRLQYGVSIDETLRSEVYDAELVLALLTPHALESTYVVFEMGARWGTKKPMIPVLAAGLEPTDLEPPLSGINAAKCSDRPEVSRLLSDIAEYLGVERTKDNSTSEIDNVLGMSWRSQMQIETQERYSREIRDKTAREISDYGQKLLVGIFESDIPEITVYDGMLDKVPAFDSKIGEDSESVYGDLRRDDAAAELRHRGLVVSVGKTGKEERFRLTGDGFRVAYVLKQWMRMEGDLDHEVEIPIEDEHLYE